MPNIKSAKKRVLVNTKKTEQNKAIRSEVKTEIKKVELLIKENKFEEAKVALASAFSAIDSACSKNIYQKNNAANKKAKLAKKIDAAIKAAGVSEIAVAEVKEEAPVVEEVKEEKKAPAKKTTKKAAEKEPAEKKPAKKATKKADKE